MKKLRLVKALFAAAALALAVAGCSDVSSSDSAPVEQTQQKTSNGTIKISVANGYARTALPTDIKLADYTYTLKKTQGTDTTFVVGKEAAVSYADLLTTNAVVAAGSYAFTLTAYNKDGAVLQGTLSDVTVAEGETTTLPFTLFAYDEEAAEGTVQITVDYPENYGVAKVVAYLFTDEPDTADEKFLDNATSLDYDADTKTVSGTVPVGYSEVYLLLLNEDSDEISFDIVPVYAVRGGTSTDSLTLDVLQYKATVKLTSDAENPSVTLKNEHTDGIVLSLAQDSTDTYTALVPFGTYTILVDGEAHGTLNNATPADIDTSLTLQSIAAAWTDGTQPEFFVGTTAEKILAALTVTGTYTDAENKETEKPVTGFAIKDGTFSADTSDEQTVTLTYGEKETTIKVTLTAEKVDSIEISAKPTKTLYKVGASLDLAGLVLTATKNTGDTTEIAWSADTASDIAATGFDATTAAENQTITVTYADAEATFTVDIVALSKIEVTTPPTTSAYTTKDTELDTTGIVVTATYGETEGKTIIEDVTAAVAFKDFDLKKSGTQNVTVSYTEGEGANAITKTTTFTITVAHEYAYTAKIDLTDTKPSAWNGVPVRSSSSSTNVSAKVTRAIDSYAGYLGRKFWLVDGVYAEYTGGNNGLGYTDTANDANRPATESFAKAIETEAIKGPFKLTVQTQTNAKARIFKVYQSTSLENLWDAANVVKEVALDNKPNIVYEYSGSDTVYIGMGTLSAKDGEVYKVYTAISAITLETDTKISDDVFSATSIAFTNAEIADGALTITKDTANYTLTAAVTPSYATDTSYTFSYVKTAGTGDHVSVSTDGKITITGADDMTQNEVGTITVTAKGGENVTATLTLTVKGEITAADKIAQTKTELESAFGTGTAFEYGNSSTAETNATAFINAPNSALTYKDDVTVTPAVDATTGDLTLTISIQDNEEKETVTYAYTDELAKAAVADAVAALKAANLAWDTSADTTADKVTATINTLTLTDATAQAAVVEKTVVVTVTSKFKSDVKDASIVLEAPKFEVKDGVLYLLAEEYEYAFASDNLAATAGDNAWTVSTNGITTTEVQGVTRFNEKSFTGINLKKSSGANHTVTLKFSGVAKVDLYVTDSNKGRTFTINGTTYKTAIEAASGDAKDIVYATSNANNTKEFIYTIEIEDPSAITTWVIGNDTSNGLNPIGIVLHAPTGEKTPISGKVNAPLSDIVLEKAENSYAYTVSGAPVSETGAQIAWYVDDAKVEGANGTSYTLSDKTLGEYYTVRVDVTVGGVTYSQSESVLYQ